MLLKIISPISLFCGFETFRDLGGDTESLAHRTVLRSCGCLSVSSTWPGSRPGGITGPCVPCPLWTPSYSDTGLFSGNMISPEWHVTTLFKLETKHLWLSFSCAALQGWESSIKHRQGISLPWSWLNASLQGVRPNDAAYYIPQNIRTFIRLNCFSCYLLEFPLTHHLYRSFFILLYTPCWRFITSTNKNMFLILFFNVKPSGFVMAAELHELHS